MAAPQAHPMPHPRRPPAHRSVSLRHSPENVSRSYPHMMHRPTQKGSSSDSSSSLKPLISKADSGESSNADKWFERTNNDASGNKTFNDDSPPFFFQNSSSGETQNGLHANANGTHLRNTLLHLATDNSSTEDFRGVIDDLTIENQKLKRKLKTYEKLQDSHLKDQKLFEVRVHGLPPHKKMELEEMLRKFATGLNGPAAGSEHPSNLFATLPAGLVSAKHKSGSSQASHLHADSAYHSASASGPASSAQGASSGSKKPAHEKSRQNIQSYLHDIPEGLLPRQPSVMTEKTRGKLVVRRLEHIFAGKGAADGMHQHPIQQQELSHLAAKADRSELENSGHQVPPEGIRESRILSAKEDDAQQAAAEAAAASGTDQILGEAIATQDFARKDNEQRPTRPLDLDPERAQVPADNFQYIRHLGFSPPRAENNMASHEDGHGWIYLNLLVNMAQLHNINVTADFIRKSVVERSKKLELSADGRKVRWKGGMSVTRNSSDGDETPDMTAAMPSERGSPRKRMKLSAIDSSSSSSIPRRNSKVVIKPKQDSRLSYTPLFHHRGSEDSATESDSEDEDTTESFPMARNGASSAMASSANPNFPAKRNKKRETGPIIFYNNARFCTDLSGDSKTEETMMYNPYLYHRLTAEAVGVPPTRLDSTPNSELKGPLSTTASLPEAMDLDDNPIPSEFEISFPYVSPLSSQHGRSQRMYSLEVSGIGGVCPADNFAINVSSRHARTDNITAPEQTADHAIPARYPSRIATILRNGAKGRSARTAFHKEVLSADRRDLPPSELPDASCFMPADGEISPGTDEDDMDGYGDDDEDDDGLSVAGSEGGFLAPSTARQHLDADYASDSEDDGQSGEEGCELDGDDDDYDDDDGASGTASLDLLAHAREIDPEAIRRRELEYDANMAERLAEEIPAGSSAATAGGGSGFNSPVSDAGSSFSRGVKRRRSHGVKVPSSLKKARTGDSMDTLGHEGSDDES